MTYANKLRVRDSQSHSGPESGYLALGGTLKAMTQSWLSQVNDCDLAIVAHKRKYSTSRAIHGDDIFPPDVNIFDTAPNFGRAYWTSHPGLHVCCTTKAHWAEKREPGVTSSCKKQADNRIFVKRFRVPVIFEVPTPRQQVLKLRT